MKKESRVAHQPKASLLEGNTPVVPPIYQSVKFTFPTIDASLTKDAQARGYDYTRGSNPTTRQLELLCAELQDRDDAIAVSTGMAAVWLSLLGTLKTGDRVVIFLESYRPTRVAARRMLPRFGIEHVMLSVDDRTGLARELADPRTKAVFIESPTNPMLRIPDIDAIVSVAREHGVLSILDNTFAGFHNHGQFEIDYFVHSLTKYANGHGDVMGGIVIGSSQRIKPLKPLAVNMGSTLDPGAAAQISRGMKTYYLRYARHCENALAIAEYLQSRPEVRQVFYPGLDTHPDYERACAQMHDFGGVLTFDLDTDQDGAWRFIDSLNIFVTTASLGSIDSLVAPVELYLGSDLSEDERQRAGISASTVRFAVGIEHIDDLIGDIDQALEKVFTAG